MQVDTPAKKVKFLELYPCVPSYAYMFMLEAMTYKVDRLCDFGRFRQMYFVGTAKTSYAETPS